MFARILCAFVASAIAVTSLPPPADAQFGIRRAFRGVVGAPVRILPRHALPLVVFGGPFRGAFGVVAAVAVGTVIFTALSRPERREVARRAKVVVAKDPDQRVSDTYTSKDGTKQVTIVAEPMQKASDLKNDPAILVVADKVVDPSGKDAKDASSATAGAGLAGDSSKVADAGSQTAPAPEKPVADKKAEAKPVADEEVVKIGDIPPDTQCRKVTTDLEVRKKKDQETADQKNSNTSIFCQMAPGQWKPAAA
jgi:hypothetical protein